MQIKGRVLCRKTLEEIHWGRERGSLWPARRGNVTASGLMCNAIGIAVVACICIFCVPFVRHSDDSYGTTVTLSLTLSSVTRSPACSTAFVGRLQLRYDPGGMRCRCCHHACGQHCLAPQGGTGVLRWHMMRHGDANRTFAIAPKELVGLLVPRFSSPRNVDYMCTSMRWLLHACSPKSGYAPIISVCKADVFLRHSCERPHHWQAPEFCLCSRIFIM